MLNFNIADLNDTMSPLTVAKLHCGAVDFIPGHDVEVGDIVTCPEAGECLGCYSTGGDAYVNEVVRTSTFATL